MLPVKTYGHSPLKNVYFFDVFFYLYSILIIDRQEAEYMNYKRNLFTVIVVGFVVGLGTNVSYADSTSQVNSKLVSFGSVTFFL